MFGLSFVSSSVRASNPTDVIAADGAVGTNADWESGKSPIWYIELQRLGAKYIIGGIQNENPALITEGFKIIDWGWAHQGPNGDFPGTGSGTAGNKFHSTSLFFEAVARAMIALKSYRPTTYTLAPGFYNTKIADYANHLESCGQWLTNPLIQGPGRINDATYTHRAYLLAAGLQETSVLTGDTNFPVIASQYVQIGLAKQLPQGWVGALTKDNTGKVLPAILVAPGGVLPAGTFATVDASGVDPENHGYDVSYQMVGILHASRWYAVATDPILKSEVSTILTNAMLWERNRTSVNGIVDSTGSSRVGVEKTQNGLGIKTLAKGEVVEAFLQGSDITSSAKDRLAGIRIRNNGVVVSPDTIAPDGAVGANANWDTNNNLSYNMTLQRDAEEFVLAGIQNSNDAYVAKGMTILKWGFARQAPDGSFPGNVKPYVYTSTAYFIEAAAHCILALQADAVLHPKRAAHLANTYDQMKAQIALSAQWLAANTSLIHGTELGSAFRQFLFGAALGEAAALSGNTLQNTLAVQFVKAGIGMQLADGTYPEHGLFNAAQQAVSAGYAEDDYDYLTLDQATAAALKASISSALVKESAIINIDGTFNASISSPQSVSDAMDNGARITGNPQFEVYYMRIVDGDLGLIAQ